MSFDNLKVLYHENKLPIVISDSNYVLYRFGDIGFETGSIDDVSSGKLTLNDSVLLIPAVSSKHPNPGLLKSLENSATLLVPLLAFSADDRDVDYLINRLSTLSFKAACEKNSELIEYVQHARDTITVNSTSCEMKVDLGKNVDVMIPKILPEIKIGECISIIQFLEVGLVPNEDNSSFLITGSFSCDGCVVAHHLHTHSESGPVAEEVWRIFDDLRKKNQFPLTLNIKDSRLESIHTKDGTNITESIISCTDEMRRGGLTEFAFGALDSNDKVDWTHNSQLNEPAGGVHVGIGAGETGAHIDFVSRHAIFR